MISGEALRPGGLFFVDSAQTSNSLNCTYFSLCYVFLYHFCVFYRVFIVRAAFVRIKLMMMIGVLD